MYKIPYKYYFNHMINNPDLLDDGLTRFYLNSNYDSLDYYLIKGRVVYASYGKFLPEIQNYEAIVDELGDCFDRRRL